MYRRSVEAGCFSRCRLALVGRSTSSPPQLGQMSSIASVHSAQKVHSKLQMNAPGACGGRSVPQLLKNVVYSGGDPLADAQVKAAIAAGEAALAGRGRLVIRKSGTEPKIRVMAEGDDASLVERVVDDICAAVKAAA